MARTSTTFAKGQSGNPKGRPKILTEVRAAYRAETGRNLATLIELRDSSTDDRVRLAAAVAIEDRAWGRPAQVITGADEGPVRVDTGLLTLLQQLSGDSGGSDGSDEPA